ncbi:MAG: DUF4349 domain-containing protein [Leptospiraceae bacterium]|nr:DUF4349 domain-containing protein [Leptospiraceae bacterium]
MDPQEASMEASGVSDSGYSPPRQELAQRKLIRTGMLQLILEDEEQYLNTIKQAHGLVKQFDGYIASESIGKQEGLIILRVPDSALEEVMSQLGQGKEIATTRISVRDVTETYTDTEVRLKNLRSLQTRLQGLLTRANDVETVLKVESELSRVSSDLESLEAKMRMLKNQVSLATLQLDMEWEEPRGPIGWIFYGIYVVFDWLI